MSRADDLAGRVVLVTGASGFLGGRTVAVLSGRGCQVRALVRKTSRTDHLGLSNVTLFRGDVADAESLTSAFEGAEFVVHTAADTGGSETEGRSGTVVGTENVLALCALHGIRRLVYISSCNVYGTAGYRHGQLVTEESPLETSPGKRGYYTHSKLEAEQIVSRAMENGTVPIVCLRPGTIYGPGGDVFTPMLGFSWGRRLFAVIGDGSFILPLVYVDNMVEAIVAALEKPSCTNRIYTVVDPDKVTKREYMEGLVQRLYPRSITLYIPYSLVKGGVFLQERLCTAIRKKPFLTMYRLLSSQNPVVYDTSRISGELSWKPAVTVETAYRNVIRFEDSGS